MKITGYRMNEIADVDGFKKMDTEDYSLLNEQLRIESMDYWRLCDELSVVQAALLVIGEDPSKEKAMSSIIMEFLISLS
jgi:hypothetical protein